MVSDWFEKDNFNYTVRQVLIDALKEIKVDFHGLDPVVQATLLDEAAQVGVQRSLQPLMRIKAVMEEANADENFQKQIVTEIYRERGKTHVLRRCTVRACTGYCVATTNVAAAAAAANATTRMVHASVDAMKASPHKPGAYSVCRPPSQPGTRAKVSAFVTRPALGNSSTNKIKRLG
jgi:hypothetical protein